MTVIFHKEQLTFTPQSTDPLNDLMLAILGAFAEFERTIIRERQAEGIAIAKIKDCIGEDREL
ncbi:recombinase family protein [Corynebacterium pseudotuberculosis]|uniref:recombinase family protein n=1 Tax=Corynebacterium pseudotuberculosis TaxID=1719 RepID=UPI000A709AC7|nr:recombinase family protein [Corynebacterium pseudotuberculosis]UTO24073.1 recombinase family protein [Corynebacterium pseudotuberculosis]VTQ76573.1 DNA-invertase [Corynebacterium pseudotuberculosis]